MHNLYLWINMVIVGKVKRILHGRVAAVLKDILSFIYSFYSLCNFLLVDDDIVLLL